MAERHGSTSMATSMGFDDFMKYEGAKGGASGGFLGGWKKNEEGPGGLGMVTVFLHRKTWATAFWLHNWPRLVETTDKETEDKTMHVWGSRWGCHEREIVNQKQHFRDKKTHERDYPPEVCPICRFNDYLAKLYFNGKIKLTTPVFQFEGDDPAESITLTVGGMIGRYGAKELSIPEKREMKSARINGKEAFKEDMRTKLKYLYLVVDAAHPENGVQKTFEGQGLTNAVKGAVKDTRTRLDRKGKGALANPVENPYPFEWTYDDSKDFDEKFSVVALAEDSGPYAVPDDVMSLISGDPPDIARDIAVGNCFELRGQMEAHLVPGFKVDWDEVFGPAKEAGLMVPPEETKADEDGEDEGAPAGDLQVVVLDATHPVWTTKGWKPDASFNAGVEVHTDTPDGFDDAERDRIEMLITATGALVGQRVFCDHCQDVITTLDAECEACGSTYNDDGLLASRPCLKPECDGQCELTPPGPESLGTSICGKCGTIHEAVSGTRDGAPAVIWQLKPEEVKPAPAKAAAGRRRPAPVAAAGASSNAPPKGAPPFA